jgi:CheY-like chemotaxis protein
MDLIMPVMNGFDSTQEIRTLEIEMNLSEADKHYICGFSAEVNP